MTPAAFLSAIADHLQRCKVPFAHGDLIAFVEAAWPCVEEPVCVDRWTQEFLGSQLRGLVDGIGVLPAGVAGADAGE